MAHSVSSRLLVLFYITVVFADGRLVELRTDSGSKSADSAYLRSVHQMLRVR